MLKSVAQLEHKIGDRVYQFVCDPASPVQEVMQALSKMMGWASQLEDQIKAQQAQQAAQMPQPTPPVTDESVHPMTQAEPSKE